MTAPWLEQLQVRPEALLASLAAGAVMLGLTGYLYVLQPALRELRELREQGSGALLAEGVVAEVGAASIERLEREVEAVRERLYGASGQVAPDRMEAWVINGLDRLSLRHGVQLVSVAPEGPRPVLVFDELPVQVHVQAGYFDLFAWLTDVEQELRPLVVKEFALSGTGEPGRVSLQLRLVSFRPRSEGAS